MPGMQCYRPENSVSAASHRAGALFPCHAKNIGGKFMSSLPLTGIKILDLTRVLAGPLSAQMLGDLGAEVIKVERPGGGDDARAFGPPYLEDPEGRENNNNSFYLCANRNKKSVTVNIAKPEGQEIIRELARSCDVMMENYKVGDLKRYALDSEIDQEGQPRHHLLLGDRLRPDRTLCAARRLRRDLPGDGRIDECHRPYRRRTGRRSHEGRPLHRRLHDRHEHLDRDSRRALSPQGQWRGGAAYRRLPARHRDRLAVALRPDLPRQRQHPAAARHLG